MKANWYADDERRSGMWGYGIAVVAVAVATLLKLLLGTVIHQESPFILFFGTVMLVAWLGGRRAGLLATVLAVLSADFFFMAPYLSFLPENAGQVLRLAVFFVEGTLASLLVSELFRARRQAEERAAEVQGYQRDLKENEERSRRLADEVVEGLALSENGEVFDVNKTFTSMFGYEYEEAQGMDAMSLVARADREEVARRIRTDDTGVYEVSVVRKDGTTFPAEIRPGFMDYRGRRVRVTSILDITERKRGEDASRFLGDASDILASSLDYGTTLASVARLAVPSMADWCAVDVIGEDGTVERLAVEHQDPEKIALAHELQERYPTDPNSEVGLPGVLRSGEPQMAAEIPESLLRESAMDDEHRELLRRLDLRSYMIVPLSFQGQVLGAITFVMGESGRRYNEADLKIAEDLARRAAVAVQNARLYDEAQREIFQKERAQSELRHQRDLYETLLQAQSEVGEGFVILEGSRIVYVNGAFCGISGYNEHELIALPSLFELFVPEERTAFVERFKRRMSGEGGESHQEITLLRKDGESVALEIAVREFRFGETLQFVIIARDVTERKRTEQALRQSEERYRAVIEQAAEGIILVDADEHHILEANPEFRRMFGYASEEVTGLTIYDLVADDRKSVDHNIEITLEEGNRVVGERRYRRKDGSLLDVIVSGSTVSYGGRRAIGIVIRDITERKQAEEELQRSERGLITAQRIARLGSWEYVLDEDAAQWSNELYRIFGFTPHEFVPRYETFFEHVHPDDRRAVQKEAIRALRGRGNSNIDYRIVRSNREVRNVYTEYEVVRDASDRPIRIVGTVQDITEQKRVNEELEARAEELERSNAELERFAYIASHDLQEPLRMVSSYTQLLSRRYRGKLDQDADEFIAYAVDGATRMQTLINDLLTYSRVGTKGREFSSTDLSKVFEAVRDNLRVAVEESGATVTSDQLPTVMGDFTQLVQLFQNLIGNAIKFRGEEPPEINVGAERRGRDWVLRVRDNGIGIDPRYAERVFVIFQRLHTKEDYPGTGIGLAVCKRIVERHGGRMWIESEPGEGSTFFFTLPVTKSDRR